MKARKNLLVAYLAGDLSIEDVRTQVASGTDRTAKQLLRLAEFDHRCQRILAPLEPPSRAADRLAELVSTPEAYIRPKAAEASRSVLGTLANDVKFDVVGAQYIPKKERQKLQKKERTAKLKKSRRRPRRHD